MGSNQSKPNGGGASGYVNRFSLVVDEGGSGGLMVTAFFPLLDVVVANRKMTVEGWGAVSELYKVTVIAVTLSFAR